MCVSLPLASAQVSPTPAPSVTAAPTLSYEPTFESALLAYEIGDFSTALRMAESFGHTGRSEAQVMAGHIHLRGETGLANPDTALMWFRKAADQQDNDAYMAIGEMALRSQAGLTQSDALEWFSKASRAGRVDAKRAIGEMYLKGQGITPSREKGQDWLSQAADMGDALAMQKLAETYFDTDPNRALDLYERAAGYGDIDAAYIAAIMYAENLDVRPNSQKLTDLLRQAADGGHAAAQADYGLLVYQGAGVTRSDIEAAKWFEKSAKGGDPEGQFLYAFTLAKGEGVERSYEDAYYWLLKSGESDVDAYKKDRAALRQRLEANVDPSILQKARNRAEN